MQLVLLLRQRCEPPGMPYVQIKRLDRGCNCCLCVGHHERMDLDWAALATAIAARRKALGLTQQDLADQAGVGLTTIQKLERSSETWSKVQPVHREAAYLLGWTRESVEELLQGGEPTIAAGGMPASLPANAPDRVREALRGTLVDAEVIDLAPDDPERQAVLLFKRGTKPATAEEMRRWSKAARAARNILSGDDD